MFFLVRLAGKYAHLIIILEDMVFRACKEDLGKICNKKEKNVAFCALFPYHCRKRDGCSREPCIESYQARRFDDGDEPL